MSWEIMDAKEISCPCGQGKIIRKSLSDDWNRFREDISIQCQNCSKQYKIISRTTTLKPYHENTFYYCADKETGEELELEL